MDRSDYFLIISLIGLFICLNFSMSSAIPTVEIARKNRTYINQTVDQTMYYYFDKWLNHSDNYIYPNESYSLNVYVNGTLNATTINASLDCSMITGGGDGDYCTDTGGNNCSSIGLCSNIAYMNYNNVGNLNATNISSDYLNSTIIDSDDIGTDLLNVTENITLGEHRIEVGDADLVIVL